MNAEQQIRDMNHAEVFHTIHLCKLRLSHLCEQSRDCDQCGHKCQCPLEPKKEHIKKS